MEPTVLPHAAIANFSLSVTCGDSSPRGRAKGLEAERGLDAATPPPLRGTSPYTGEAWAAAKVNPSSPAVHLPLRNPNFRTSTTKNLPRALRQEGGKTVCSFYTGKLPGAPGLMPLPKQGIRTRTLCFRHTRGVLSRALAGALVFQAARPARAGQGERAKIFGVRSSNRSITCTARPYGSGARNGPRRPSGSWRTDPWHARGRHAPDGCSGSRSSADPGTSRRQRPWRSG